MQRSINNKTVRGNLWMVPIWQQINGIVLLTMQYCEKQFPRIMFLTHLIFMNIRQRIAT